MKKVCALLLALVLVLSIFHFQNNNHTVPKVEDLFVYTEEIDTHRFYYNQLSNFEQELYKRITAHEEQLISNQNFVWIYADEWESKSITTTTLLRVINAYTSDNPLANMWLFDPAYKILENGDTILTIPKGQKTFGAFSSPAETRAALKEVEETAQKFVSTLYGSEEEKHRQIYSYISSGAFFASEELWSDETRPLTVSTAYACLEYSEYSLKLAICNGFSRAYKYLADLAGLKAIFIYGSSTTENYELSLNKTINKQPLIEKFLKQKPYIQANHAWIMIWTDATGWTLADITQENHFSSYTLQPDGNELPETSYDWFMKDIIEDFNEGYHIPCELFIYPLIQ